MTNQDLIRLQTINRLIAKDINGTTASKQLKLSVRQIKRLKKKVLVQGAKGLIHASRGRPGNRGVKEKLRAKIVHWLKTKYLDFKPTLFWEKLTEIHHLKISVETIRRIMIAEKLWQPKPKRSGKKHRQWRARKPCRGEMLQYDGSYHRWFEDRGNECCLLASIDDATNQVSLMFAEDEGVKASFVFWQEYVQRYGKPNSIYLDHYSTYQVNNNFRNRLRDGQNLTQWQRAMKDLDINIIYANSPQAKGRVERLFQTLQDRLIKELRLAKINHIDQANCWLKKIFTPKFNRKFSVIPASHDDRHQPLTAIEKQNLKRIFSTQKYRVLTNDYTLRYGHQYYQLLKKQPTMVCPQDKIMIEIGLDENIRLSFKEHYLDYCLLPAKPIKNMLLKKTNKSPRIYWKPPLTHPWKRKLYEKEMMLKGDISKLEKV